VCEEKFPITIEESEIFSCYITDMLFKFNSSVKLYKSQFIYLRALVNLKAVNSVINENFIVSSINILKYKTYKFKDSER